MCFVYSSLFIYTRLCCSLCLGCIEELIAAADSRIYGEEDIEDSPENDVGQPAGSAFPTSPSGSTQPQSHARTGARESRKKVQLGAVTSRDTINRQADPNPSSTLSSPELEELHMDYGKCKASLVGKSLRKTLPSLHWIHVPKAATSFGYVLFSYLCTGHEADASLSKNSCNYCGKDIPPGIWDRELRVLLPKGLLPYCDKQVEFRGLLQNHLPVPQPPHKDDRFVGLLRDPRRRLVSAYNHGKHSFGIGQRNAKMAKASREHMLQHTHSLRDYVEYPDIKNCATKMLLGDFCALDTNITRTHLDQAKRILSSFAFVGITEAFNASVCLFHHMFGGDLHEFEFGVMREGRPFNEREYSLLPGGSLRVHPDSWFVWLCRCLPLSCACVCV